MCNYKYSYTLHIHVGNPLFRLIPIVERQWTDEINELISVGTTVKARVYAIRDPEWFRFPVQLEILEPAIGHMMYGFWGRGWWCSCMMVWNVGGGGVH